MIDDLDRTLETLLRNELLGQLVEQLVISFVTPDGHFPPAGVKLPALDLFLYDVRENRSLRSTEWWTGRRDDGTSFRKRAPVRVDCSYLVTAWADPLSDAAAQQEHHILGAVMKVLLRHPTLPAALLHGALSSQEIDPPTCALQAGQLQSVAELWQALGGRPRAALNYTVTLSIDALASEVPAPPATDLRVELQTGVSRGGA